MILMVHVRTIMNWGMPEFPVADIAQVAARYPETPVVLCGVNSEWRQAVTFMKKYSNLLIETSCLQYVDMISLFTEELGSRRILFGSGLALQYPQCGLIKITKAKIPAAARRDILGGNAERLLG
jgi:predicted TIM-barrel fold metal-dependent hydrolase